jgi:ADP-dependent NAD(P)H-hydrate dehydratase / NAD(P)H-hydrate epimerase
MGSVTADEMRRIEETAFRAGSTPEGLMRIAGRRLGLGLARFFPLPGTAVAFLGKGHNAGDALIALGVLREAGWRILVRPAFPEVQWATLTRSAFRGLGDVEVVDRLDPEDCGRPLVLLDGLVGIGARGPLRGALAGLAVEMNVLKDSGGAKIAAVDLPSGLDPDSGEIFPGAVRADVTFTIGVPKCGLLRSCAVNAVGALALVPLSELPLPPAGDLAMISPQSLDAGFLPRPFDFHKGLAGRVGILAGSEAYRGAAILAATGALRAGAGLVTLHVPKDLVERISSGCPAELIVRGYGGFEDLMDFSHDAWVVGPGLGELDDTRSEGLMKLLERGSIPCVVDADALNAVARKSAVGRLPAGHVMTPHPGEFRRLAPDLADLTREVAARTFADRNLPALLLKGARTLVTLKGQALWCNSTGTPGMSTGGQGDVLSGVIGALLAAGAPALEAAARGAWLCGRASEIALAHRRQSEESLLPHDTLDHLGQAFLDWREKAR